jgi:hypothetical protein
MLPSYFIVFVSLIDCVRHSVIFSFAAHATVMIDSAIIDAISSIYQMEYIKIISNSLNKLLAICVSIYFFGGFLPPYPIFFGIVVSPS